MGINKLSGFLALLFLLLSVARPAVADEPAATLKGFPGVAHPWEWRPAPAGQGLVSFSAIFQTLFVYKNDADFDDTAPAYDESGQHVGLLGTFLKPVLTLHPLAGLEGAPELEILWDSEFGLNLWSVQDPDQYGTGEPSTVRFSQRQIYAKGSFWDGKLGFQAGYQYFTDPTMLFLGHWIGAARIWSDLGWARFEVMAGQMPDQTFEGISLESTNNFTRDTFVYGALGEFRVGPRVLTVGLHGLHDAQVVDQTLDLLTATATGRCDQGWFRFGWDLAFQYGLTQNGAQGGDEETLAWALQLHGDVLLGPVVLSLTQLVLSADDGHDRNGHNGAFFYSAKTRSRTLMLSEDEIRDRGANFDERLAERRQKFFLVRSGLSLTDLTVTWKATPWFVPSLTLGAAFALEPDNAAGSRFVGFETDLNLRFVYRDRLEFHLAGAFLQPGKALSAYANPYDREATNPQFLLESSLFVYF